jgi:hypothetical protein
MGDIWRALQHCEYTFTDALFRIVEQNTRKVSSSALESNVRVACQFPKNATAMTSEAQTK